MIEPAFEGTERFEIIKELGAGGMGTVYEAHDHALGVRCALKVLKHQDPNALVRFKREFRSIASLRHPHLVHLHDLVTPQSGLWFYTMQLIEGSNLRDVLHSNDAAAGLRQSSLRTRAIGELQLHDSVELITQQSPSLANLLHQYPHTVVLDTPINTTLEAPVDPPSRTKRRRSKHKLPTPACDVLALLSSLAQILDSLEFLHSRQIVHCDLKPDNVLVDDRGHVFILDFGMIKLLDMIDDGSTGGTYDYMAPEMVRGESITGATDLYALGCILFELLTQHLPFSGTPWQIMMGHHGRKPPLLSDFIEDVPSTLTELVDALLHKDAHERPSIDDIRTTLRLRTVSQAPELQEQLTSSLFVGRADELSQLNTCWQQTQQGHTHIAVVEGASGVGKTALCTNVVKTAREQRQHVFYGRCYEREQLPFRAFDQVIDAISITLTQWDPDDLQPLANDLRIASTIFPVLRMTLSALPDMPHETHSPKGVGAQTEREACFAALNNIISALCKKNSTLITLDDLQWCDEESIQHR